jgi:hypothetical protein
MNRREILNELQQIVAVTDTVGPTASGALEVARRAKGLIQVIESWPIAFPPAPFVSDQCCERKHAECLMKHGCKCACHCPPEAPQQPVEPAPPAERHIDTPDELLELLAGVSSDPQIEGLSLAQKASTMALLYAAKALRDIKACLLRNESSGYTERERQREHRAAIENQAELSAKALQVIANVRATFAARILDAANSTQEPS